MTVFNTPLPGYLSCLTGKIAAIPIPFPLRVPFFKKAASVLGIHLSEVEKPLDHYPSLNAFFARGLNEACRPVDPNPSHITSPVDGQILEFGTIHEGQLLQAKGREYPLKKFIPFPISDRFEGGSFMTFYLSPKDCHRIFAPIAGKVTDAYLVPGALYPVREPYISEQDALYVQNERLISIISHPATTLACVKVGAINVGAISVQYDPTLKSYPTPRKLVGRHYDIPASFNKGDWLGTFHLGSTVILIAEKDTVSWLPDLARKQHIRYGQPIAILKGQE